MRLFFLLCCGICLLLPLLHGSANAADIRIEDTNLSGGGFQSDVTVSDDGKILFSSGDVSGVSKSTDGGVRFETHNQGLLSRKIASIAITPDNHQIIYAGTGDKGASGGLFRSIDGGERWTLTQEGDKAQFAGNHSAAGDPIPKKHPRPNGDLIVVDPGKNPAIHTDDTVIAGTYKNGVKLFVQGGDKEVAATNTSGFVRSVARNNSLPDIAFAAIQFADQAKNGIYKIDYSDISQPSSTLVYATLRPEGVTVLDNGHVYGAIGAEGIVRFDGEVWQLQNNGLSTKNQNRQWTAVTGYTAGNSDVVYAGTTNMGGRAKGKPYSNVWRTTDGGNRWSPLVNADTNVSDTIHGQTHDWWFRTHAFNQAGLGRTNSVVSSIAVVRGDLPDKVSDDVIYVSGRGGLWKSADGGDVWEPAVNNMQVTANNGVAVNPNNPSQVALANTDFVVMATNAGFTGSNLFRAKPKGAESKGYDVIFDVTSNDLILGVGDRDTNSPGGGEVYIKPADQLGSKPKHKWINTNLSTATSANNGRVRAVAYGYHDGTSATSQTLLAAVEDEGVFRWQNGTWSKSNGIKIGSTKRSNFIWPDNQNAGVVYLVDLSAGLYRSNDGGQNWANIWPTVSFRNNDFYNTGYIAADDNNPTTIYLSVQGERGSPIGANLRVYRLASADSTIFGNPDGPNITTIGNHSGKSKIKRPGPLVIGPEGELWLTEQQDSRKSVGAALYRMDNPASDKSFTDLTTDDYRRAAISPSGIDVSSDGYIYISQNGIGVLKLALP